MSEPAAARTLRAWLDQCNTVDTAAEAHGRPILHNDQGRVLATVHNFDKTIPPMSWDEVAALREILDLLPWFLRQAPNDDAEHPHANCPECGSRVPLTTDGMLPQHTSQEWCGGWRQVCAAGGRPAVPTAVGEELFPPSAATVKRICADILAKIGHYGVSEWGVGADEIWDTWEPFHKLTKEQQDVVVRLVDSEMYGR